MKKYRGFLYQYSEHRQEIKEWFGGNSPEGTGEYEVIPGYQIVHPNSGKSTWVKVLNEKEILQIIDRLNDEKEINKKAIAEIKKKETELAQFEQKTQDTIDKLQESIYCKRIEVTKYINDQKKYLFPIFY